MSEEAIGHNAVDAEKLKQYVNAILEVRTEREALAMDERGLFAKADEEGLDPKKIREVLREMNRPKDADYKYLLNRYLTSLGKEKLYHE